MMAMPSVQDAATNNNAVRAYVMLAKGTGYAMKYQVSGICRSAGVVITRQFEAPDPLAAQSMAARTMVVFDVEPVDAEPLPNPALASVSSSHAPGDSARRMAFVGSILLLAAMLTWSARQNAMDRHQADSAVQPVVVLSTQASPLPQLARTNAMPLTPTHVALTH